MASSSLRSRTEPGSGVLPIDTLYEILIRLPAKELCRLRAVCRPWRLPQQGNTSWLRVIDNAIYSNPYEKICEVFALGGSGNARWRGKTAPPDPVSMFSLRRVVVDGIVYFLLDDNVVDHDVWPSGIVSFDILTEEWRVTLRGPVNNIVQDDLVDYVNLSLVALNGFLVVVQHNLNASMDLWFLMDFERGLWVKQHTVQLSWSAQHGEFRPHPLMILNDGRIVTYIGSMGLLRIYNPKANTHTDVAELRPCVGIDSIRNPLESMLHDEDAEPTDLPIKLLKEITKDFSDDLEIGNGGFAVVYKGLLGNGTTIAVKKLSRSIDMDENKYNQEVACLMRVKHKNIVRFLGYCADTQGKIWDHGGKFVMADVRQRLLCFEYLPKGSLEQYISDASVGLKWRKRYEIIKGICEGLHYLHGERIVHLDLKPANILLDDDMVPKITDFGLSRCFDENQSRAITSNLAGSLGYMAPEYISTVITFKSDIYSLGVIFTEMLTGQKGYTSVESILESWRNTLNTSWAEILLKQVRVCAQIGVECIDPDPEKRPVIQCIIEMLNETEKMDEFVGNDMSITSTITQFQLQITGSEEMKLEIMTRDKSIPRTVCNEFAVLVRVIAPPQCTQRLRIGLDLIAVLDISKSVERGDRLERMKQAMVFLIDNLDPDDRLSIVTFNSQVHRCTELSVMSDVSREAARNKVLELRAGLGADMGAAMQEAAKILGQRGPEERRSHVGRIILVVSNGEDNASFSEHMSREFPIETFGLGTDHKSNIIYDIADQTSGVYSYVVQDIDTALAQCIGGLTSLTAMDVEVKLEAFEGVAISSIDSGGHKATINLDDRRSGTILVHDLYAGEKKNFIVWLSIPEETKLLMALSGCYRNPKIRKEATIELDSSVVAVLRTTATASSDEVVCPEVAAELVRLRLLKCVSDMRKKNRFSLPELQEHWETIRCSQDCRTAPESTMLGLSRDVEEMKQGFYNRNPVPFLYSWMSSHLWQRANIKHSPPKSGAFRTTEMEDMLRSLYYPHLEGRSH
ncbi:putative receptor-like protein kinase [Dichanthelium oligosanthes]|uniref:Putative receptor-like protein kinase n=1 Tax=Dichanthelium oligosanthes TaxID=888268 RepID=A0A1E5V836_9POAL|nr:putative receptor-like protein kinase [Dichanthelium oligosanthes]